MAANLFYKKIRLLSEDKLNLTAINPRITIPPEYYPLLDNVRKENKVFLKNIASVVHDILLRKEEYGDGNLDKWGRFDHDKSPFIQKGLDQSPIVDKLILDVIKQLNLKAKNIWPENKKAVVCLTHDVDAIDGFSYLWLRKINWYWRWFGAKLAGNQQQANNWISTLAQWKQYKRTNFDPMVCFDQIRELEDSYGYRSTFFFMSLCCGLSKEGRRYSVQNPKVVKVTKELLEDSWEIGLHAAYHGHLSSSSLKEQKQRLEDIIEGEILGCRHHYLRVRFPDSWNIYAEAGLKYSSNMGWGSNFQGFRAGTCLPYQPLAKYSLWEIPFQLMDMNPIADIESYMKIFEQYLESTKEVNGCLILDFHQELFREELAPGVGTVYENILNSIAKDQDVAVLTMTEVYKIMKQLVS